MKTVSPFSSSSGSSDSYKIQGNSEDSDGHSNFNLESETLIACSAELVSRLQGSDISKTKHGPGHFIQKVFLHKLKSKSVPTLKSKDSLLDQEDLDPEQIEQSPNNHVEQPVVSNDSCDSWFKTWPDCGIDKIKESFINGNSEENSHNEDNAVGCNNSPDPNKSQHVPTTMDGALLNMPIAYSPITKQILILNSSDKEKPEEVVPVGSPKLPLNRKATLTNSLHRVSTEPGSFSSTVSSLSDFSPLANEDASSSSLLPENGDNCSLISIGTCSIGSEESIGEKPKRKGISSFFSRGVFGWKGKEGSSEGWSIFGKSNRTLDKYSIDEHGSIGSDSVQGSSGLIQLDRPSGLPEKTTEEKKLHADQHDTIIRTARKRELKEAKQRKKLLQCQLKTEDEVANATRVWTQEILPKWHQMRCNKKTQEMWWVGVPPGVRGRVWKLAISNDLNITQELYDICVTRAEEKLRSSRGSEWSIEESNEVESNAGRESSLELIQLDISRTFPNLCIFQKGGPYYSMLHSLLAAYVCYRPDVGYVQGMSFIAAVLILNMDAPDAFICFANLLNRPCHRAFYSLDQPQMEAYYSTYSDLLKENLPSLWSHFESTNLTPDLYLLEWVYTIYSKAMNLDLACRVWDVFLRDGDEFLFRTAIGILEMSQETLLKMDFLTGSKYLTKLPDDLDPTLLFKAIGSVKMISGKRNFQQILASSLNT